MWTNLGDPRKINMPFPMDGQSIYTIGHSTHPISYFVELLIQYKINYVVDVRSLPASRFNPQFNKKALARSLEQHGIQYFHLGEEFGARQTDPLLLNGDGQVDFQKMRSSDKFKQGIERLRKESANGNIIALMCSEAEPLDCHRFSMISPALEAFEVWHIFKDKSALTQFQLEMQLLKRYAKKLPQPDIFQRSLTYEEQLSMAYQLANKDVGYSSTAHRRGFKQ